MNILASMSRLSTAVAAVTFFTLVSAAPVLAVETTCVASGGTNCPVQIPDGPLPGIASTITVPAAQCPAGIQGVNVRVDVTHGWIGDLRMVVTNPSAVSATLLDRLASPPSFSCPGDDVAAVFSDDGVAATCQGVMVPSLSGTVTPVTPLAGLSATTAGVWTLTVTDLANGNNGAINDWAVDVVCLSPQTPIPAMSTPALLALLLSIAAAAAFAFRRKRA